MITHTYIARGDNTLYCFSAYCVVSLCFVYWMNMPSDCMYSVYTVKYESSAWKRRRRKRRIKTDQINEIAIISTCWAAAATHFLRRLRSSRDHFAGIYSYKCMRVDVVSYNQRRWLVCMCACVVVLACSQSNACCCLCCCCCYCC